METMLDIVKTRLPEGIKISAVKEDRSKYEITLTDGEYSSRCWVNKTYAPLCMSVQQIARFTMQWPALPLTVEILQKEKNFSQRSLNLVPMTKLNKQTFLMSPASNGGLFLYEGPWWVSGLAGDRQCRRAEWFDSTTPSP